MTLKVNLLSLSRGKYCLIHLEIIKRPKKEIIKSKFNSKQDNVDPPPPNNIILFELDLNVKFLLLRLLLFLNDLKSTITISAPINVITVVRMFLQEIVCKILMVGCHY